MLKLFFYKILPGEDWLKASLKEARSERVEFQSNQIGKLPWSPGLGRIIVKRVISETLFHCGDAKFSWRPQICIKAPKISSETPIFFGDPQILILDPKVFVGDPGLCIGDPKLFDKPPPNFHRDLGGGFSEHLGVYK